MKILQVGLGSMGKRRIRNLLHLGYIDILGFDLREDRRVEAQKLYGIKTVDVLTESIWSDRSHLIISTPPHMHHPYVLEGVARNKHTFIEASVLPDEYNDIMDSLKGSKFVVAPSCTMRFDPLIAKAKKFIDEGKIGKPLFATHHFGQYLPNWHPYEDIKDFYVSRKDTGAAREIVPFDLVYIAWLLGNPVEIASMRKATSTLGIDIDDIYSLLIQTDKGCQVQFSIDVVSHIGYRDTRIVGSNGNIELDFSRGILRVWDAGSREWKEMNRNTFGHGTSAEEMYVREMRAFIEATKGNEPFPFTLADDQEVLRMLVSAEASFDKKKLVAFCGK